MCFSLSCFSLNSEQINNNIDNNVDTINIDTINSIVLTGYGHTIRYKTNVGTIWKDIKIVYNPQSGTLDGIGISVFNRKEYMFLLLGNIKQTINNQIIIQLKKIHPAITDVTSGNCIEYTGFYSTSEKDVIYLISHQSSGYLKLKIE